MDLSPSLRSRDGALHRPEHGNDLSAFSGVAGGILCYARIGNHCFRAICISSSAELRTDVARGLQEDQDPIGVDDVANSRSSLHGG